MSYILDALRKSEQQRQAVAPESVTERILIQQTPQSFPARKWILVLVIVNLLALGCFFGFANKATDKASMPVQLQATPTQANKQTVGPAVPVVSDAEMHTNVAPLQMPQLAEAKPPLASGEPESAPTIAEMMSEEVPVVAEQKSPVPPLAKKAAMVKKPMPSRAVVNARNSLEPVKHPSANYNTPNYAKIPEEVEPFFEGEKEDVRSNLKINVYSYAPEPANRFVMINMTKYKVGQLIKDGIKLKEIHQDHIVLEQGGATFNMDRP